MERLKTACFTTLRLIRQTLVGILGASIIILGIILMPLPGPGWAIVFVGLALLSTEFVWAHDLKKWIISKFKSAFNTMKERNVKK